LVQIKGAHMESTLTGMNYNLAVKLAKENGYISTSMVQRALRVGYSVAARLIDDMAANGIISDAEGNGKRKLIDSGGDGVSGRITVGT
jgi:DNA segregation ATPase FtsK/SpoIIIE-like protein